MSSLLSRHSRMLSLLAPKVRIQQSHVALFAALLLCEQMQASGSAIRITRKQIMQLSYIRAFGTYHKCLQDLVMCGVVCYHPSYNKMDGSGVRLLV